MKVWQIRILAAALAVVSAGFGGRATELAAQEISTEPLTPARDFSGFWALSFDSRKVPAADLLPSITQSVLDEKVKHDEKAIRYCMMLGMPFVMDPGRPLDIRIGSREVIIAAETWDQARHFYFRPSHIDPNIFDPTSNGDSIAHWDGDTLVVDTIGMDGNKGMVMIPGGGFRTDKTHLVERYTLMNKGAVLSVTFTWDDPTVFRTPHTYEFRYYRMPAQYVPVPTFPCNWYDDSRTKFLEGPGAIAK